jgi:hypothetical protein
VRADHPRRRALLVESVKVSRGPGGALTQICQCDRLALLADHAVSLRIEDELRRFIVVSLCTAVLATVVLSPSMAAAAAGDFYAAPSPLAAGAPGALIRTQPAPVLLPGVRATTVMYHSCTAHNDDVAVTGTVFTPTVPWIGTGPRPGVDLAVGTCGVPKVGCLR